MSDIKISQLPVYDNDDTNGSDSMPIVDSVAGVTKRITLSQLDLRWQALPSGAIEGQFLYKAPVGYAWGFPTKSQVGLGNVDNTSDLNKPVSVPTQNALSQKASLTQLALKQNQLPGGIDGQVLTLNGGLPVWEDASGASGGIVEQANQTLSAGAVISFTSSMQQMVSLQSSGGALTLAAKAFGNGPWEGGEVRILIGLSSTNYPIIETSDIEDGLISQGTLYLTKYTRSYWVYSQQQRRWFEMSRFTWNV